MNDAPEETAIYSGRTLLGALKPLARGGLEVFVADADGEFVYLAKAADRKEGAELIHNAHAARLGRARDERRAG